MVSNSFNFLQLLLIIIFTINTKPAASFSYLNNYSCSSNFTFTPNSSYEYNLKDLLSTLSYKARFTQFYNTTSGSTNAAAATGNTAVYGSFMCRGDVPLSLCGECLQIAANYVPSLCPHKKEAIIWYDECMLRYSNRNFFARMEEWPRHHWKKPSNGGDNGLNGPCFYTALGSLLKALMSEAPVAPKMFALKEGKACHNTTLYGLAQCTLDLSTDNCSRCLRDAAAGINTSCCGSGTIGERFIFPSCIVRYEMYAFSYGSETGASTPATTTNRRNKTQTQTVAIIILVLAAVSVMLSSFSCYFRRTKARKMRKAILRKNFGHDATTLESLQYDLATIAAATNKFTDANMIGKGGFGEVYKGILSDGQEIAVKRLSTNSRQGADEFKNEVFLIAKLQHKNLVRLLGFCLEEKERVLIYEYVPNRSLDYFLFDPQRQRQLTWCERYKIMEGIVRGILYLHEDSRLKIIHRDLKPSNILLDGNMNSKISDFGLARMVETNYLQENTKRIVGTYGYMAPEYAMHGKFSMKSDIFSFGVMVLEVISGKKNSYSHESYRIDDLLSYAWKQWRDHAPLDLLDPSLKATSYSQNEVVKCIHIGLLCVQENPDYRPTIATVASYLSNISMEMPFPQAPAFVTHGRMEPYIVEKGSDSSQSTNHLLMSSVNEMSISNSLPR